MRFNVSHQAGLVALVGSTTETRDVGIDVVSTTERAHRDVESIEKGGFEAWVDIYTEVFSVRELDDIKYTLPTPITIPSSDGTKVLTPEQLRPLSRCCSRDQLLSIPYPTIPTDTMTINSNLIIDAKLRNFYAHWCLKEAYIKMTGEALLADWLCDVEFRRVRPPPLSSHEGEGAWGETTHDFEIWRSGEQVKGVKMELQAFEEGYMIATAATVPHNDVSDKDETAFQDFKKLDLERDIYPATEGNLP